MKCVVEFVTDLAEFFPVAVRDEGLQGLEARVDALHASPFIAVGDLASDAPLLVPRRLRCEGNVC